MVIFNSYVKLPEGTYGILQIPEYFQKMVSIYAPVKPNLNICRSQRQLLIPAMIPTYCVHSTRVFLQLVVPIRVWNETSWITSNVPSATAIATFRTVSNISVPGKLQHLLWSTCPQLCPWWVNGYRLVNILKANKRAAVCHSLFRAAWLWLLPCS